MMETDRDFAAQLSGHRLTTAEVLYYMPDHPSLVQSFLWQTQDLAPRYPRLIRFLDFWRAEIDAVIHIDTNLVGFYQGFFFIGKVDFDFKTSIIRTEIPIREQILDLLR